MAKKLNRRKFIGNSVVASIAATIVPRHVLGGKGYIAPSDKLTMAYIGCGTQGIRELIDLLKNPKVQIVSVCDPNKFSTDYRDWSTDQIRNIVREATGNTNWGATLNGIPGGRDVGQEMVNGYYARTNATNTKKACSSYEDFRELLDKEKDFDAVKIMTPDHLHGTISIAAMNKGKHVVIHKPIANRMYEARLTIETARKTGVSTHLMAYSNIQGNQNLKKMLEDGVIGN
jgi:predicted dehydrogenase